MNTEPHRHIEQDGYTFVRCSPPPTRTDAFIQVCRDHPGEWWWYGQIVPLERITGIERELVAAGLDIKRVADTSDLIAQYEIYARMTYVPAATPGQVDVDPAIGIQQIIDRPSADPFGMFRGRARPAKLRDDR